MQTRRRFLTTLSLGGVAGLCDAVHLPAAAETLETTTLWSVNIEDTVRFFALRMRDTGLIKSAPQKIIAQGTDWRFLEEVRPQLKA